jgi:hypothetical protein
MEAPEKPEPPEKSEPWWANDPTIAALGQAALEELLQGPPRPPAPVGPDPVVAEVTSGASWRGLTEARDDLDHARLRYAEAVRDARAAGFSWGGIGRVLGVSKQSLHRRFGDVGRVD